MKLVYEEEKNSYKIYKDAFNCPLMYCIYKDEKNYKAKDRDDGLIYVAGFKDKKSVWEHFQRLYANKEENRL